MTVTYVSSGRFTNGVGVTSGNELDVLAGGTAINTTVYAAGFLDVELGAAASNTVVLRSGHENVVSGTETGILVNDGGVVTVFGPGAILGGIVKGVDAFAQALYGGVISGTMVTSSAVLDVYSGGSAVAVTVEGNTLGNASVSVFNGGTAIATSVGIGGTLNVTGSGSVTGSIVTGIEQVIGGVAMSSHILSTGSQTISLGGLAIGTLVNLGGLVTVGAGGTLNAGNIGGQANVMSGGTMVSSLIGPGGSVDVSSGGLAITPTISGKGTLILESAGAAGIGSVTFAGQGGALEFVKPPSAVVSGFSGVDILYDFATVTAATYTTTGAGVGTLTLANGPTQIGTITLAGTYVNPVFHVKPAFFGSIITLAPTANDFNADGKSDLVVQNNNGAIDIFTDNGLALSGGAVVGNPGAAWHVMGSGDFDGNGQPDLLLQNDNGAVVDYLMNGTAIAGGGQLGNPGPAWHVRGTGDFNADGRSDVLLQNDDGTMVIWNVTNSIVTGGAVLGTLPAGWSVQGVGDFNGDGVADVLVQNAASSQLVIYTTTGNAITGGGALGTPGAGWAVTGIGDYNGDGKSDILLHNDNGADVVWTVNGSTLTGSYYLGNPGASYTGAVAGIDLDGNGTSDLVVQNATDGSLVGYTLNNSVQITAGALLTTPGASWHAVGDVPTFIQNASAAGVFSGTASADQFNETIPAAGLHTIAGFDAALDTVALGVAQFPSFAAVQAAAQPYQGGTFIGFDAQTALVIQGVTPGQLTAANVVLR